MNKIEPTNCVRVCNIRVGRHQLRRVNVDIYCVFVETTTTTKKYIKNLLACSISQLIINYSVAHIAKIHIKSFNEHEFEKFTKNIGKTSMPSCFGLDGYHWFCMN